MNEQIDADAIINDLLDQLKQANLTIAILRTMVNKKAVEQEDDDE